MADKIDISVILTAHREGVLAGATANSLRQAIAHATANVGVTCEVVLVLDRSNDATTTVLENAFGGLALTVLRTDEGDPGQARNRGIAAARGDHSAICDGDDLVSTNWLTEAYRLASARPDCVVQSACNMTFGEERNLWWHVDSEGPLFDPDYLSWGNYWDAMTFARTQIYAAYPYCKNDLKLGFGHEDWHWNAMTIAAGIPHKPALETMHFKRRRAGSQMSVVIRSGATRRPLGI